MKAIVAKIKIILIILISLFVGPLYTHKPTPQK